MADRVWPPPLTNGVRRNSSKKIARRCLDIAKAQVTKFQIFGPKQQDRTDRALTSG
jgi:hypothetical protein